MTSRATLPGLMTDIPQRFVDSIDTPIGIFQFVGSADGVLLATGFCDGHPRMQQQLRRWAENSTGLVHRRTSWILRDQLQGYFDGDAGCLNELPTTAEGTVFQRDVWSALQTIPRGQTRSYADIARSIGRPKAVRAIGLANGANPVAIVVPCHRVIGADGSLAGYGAGVERKRWLLKLEGIVPTGPTSQTELFPLA